jgi:hypothetical protein
MSGTTVEVKTDPSRARVYLEGALIGRTPLKLTSLVPGNYLMTVTIDDLMWEEQVTIIRGIIFLNRNLSECLTTVWFIYRPVNL